MDDDLLVTKEQLARIFGVSTRAVTNWEVSPCDKRGRANVYNLPEVVAWKLGKANEPPSTTYELTEERSRLTHHQANMAALEEKQKRDELFSVSEVIYFCSAAHAAARNQVLGIHSKIASAYPDLDPEIIETIEEISIDAINGVGIDGIPPGLARRLAEPVRRLMEQSAETDGQ